MSRSPSRAVARRAAATLAVVALAAGGVAACGGDSSGDDGAASGAGSGGKQMTSITIASGVHGLAFAPLYLAQQAGYFADEGLQVKIANLDGAAAVNAALVSGDVFVAWGGGVDIVGAAASKQPVRLIGLSLNRLGNVLTMSKSFLAKAGIDAEAPLADKMKALKGATIAAAAPGTGGYVYISELLKEFGLDPKSDVKLVGLGGDPSTQSAALSHGRIDGTVLSPPTDTIIQHQGSGVAYVNPLTEQLPSRFAALTNNAIVASQDGLGDPVKRKIIASVLRAATRANVLIHDDPQRANQLLDKAFPELDPVVIADAMKELRPAMPVNAVPTPEMVKASLALLQHYGGHVPPANTPFSDVAVTDLEQEAYDAEAKGSGK